MRLAERAQSIDQGKHISTDFIPYRDSKLTRFLADSLGGHSFTALLIALSPTWPSFSESMSSLQFASRAKRIKNAVQLNESVDDKTLLRQYENELKRLRQQLSGVESHFSNGISGGGGDDVHRTVHQLNQDLRAEKAVRSELENQIRQLSSQLLSNSISSSSTTAASSDPLDASMSGMSRQIHTLLHQQQVYQQLLNKQREMLIALSQQLELCSRENDQLRAQCDSISKGSPISSSTMGHPMDDAERQQLLSRISELEQRDQNHEQEKRALVTILEKKMKVLVDSICSSVHIGEAVQPQSRREIEVLQKLVDASLFAMRPA